MGDQGDSIHGSHLGFACAEPFCEIGCNDGFCRSRTCACRTHVSLSSERIIVQSTVFHAGSALAFDTLQWHRLGENPRHLRFARNSGQPHSIAAIEGRSCAVLLKACAQEHSGKSPSDESRLRFGRSRMEQNTADASCHSVRHPLCIRLQSTGRPEGSWDDAELRNSLIEGRFVPSSRRRATNYWLWRSKTLFQ